MIWWPFIDGQLLVRGIDLEELFEDLPADRMMNVLDTILVDDSIAGSMVEGGIEKIRTTVLSIYNGKQSEPSSYDPSSPRAPKPAHVYTQFDDDGLVSGLEPPLG